MSFAISDDLRPRILVCDGGNQQPRYHGVQLQLNQLLRPGDQKNPVPDFMNTPDAIIEVLNSPLRDYMRTNKPYDVIIVSHPWLVEGSIYLATFLQQAGDLAQNIVVLDLEKGNAQNAGPFFDNGKAVSFSKKYFFKEIRNKFNPGKKGFEYP